MSYFAAAVARGADGWAATELDLTGVADVDEVVDRLRDTDPEAALLLLFVESDDSYLAIVRLDDGSDVRVFGSDAAFAEESRLGALLLGDVAGAPADTIGGAAGEPVDDEDDEDDDERPAADPDATPVGEAEILADLGVAGGRLLTLCAHEGLLPSDVTAELCQAIGCGDEVEELREA